MNQNRAFLLFAWVAVAILLAFEWTRFTATPTTPPPAPVAAVVADAGSAGLPSLADAPNAVALPRPVEQQPVPRPGPEAGVPPRQTNLAELLEQSVVLVLAPGQQEEGGRRALATGSGFAIAPDLVVTNLHVVDGAQRVLVTNRLLGNPVAAEIVARTPNHDFGQPDFAVLRIGGQLPPLQLAATAAPLVPVVAVGFPGFVVGAGDDFQQQAQLGGDAAIGALLFDQITGQANTTCHKNSPLGTL
jgi:S1-C subfamily serine protease